VSVLVEAAPGVELSSPAGLAELARLGVALTDIPGVQSVRSLAAPAGDGAIPESMRPSSQLGAIVDGLDSGDDPTAALVALADPVTLRSLEGALDYLDDLAVSYPDLLEAGLAGTRDDVAALREAVAAYQAAPLGDARRPEAVAAAAVVAGRLPDELKALAEAIRARPDDVFIPAAAESDPAMARLLASYLSADRRASQLSLVTADEPYSPAAFEAVRRVRELLAGWPSSSQAQVIAAAFVGGPTATAADVQTATTEDFKLVGLITVVGVFVVLTLLLRSLVAPFYLVGSVLLSFGTTMGLATFIFQGLLGQAGLNFLVPLIVFVLLVALGSDYNIFLMSRVREESVARDLRAGITVASARTGTVITSAGIILAGTFAAMTVAPLQVLQQVGLTVALGVLVDTLVVRSLLIPALTTLIGEWAWWPSRPRSKAAPAEVGASSP
jgi:uncharacterized membrane protein YdfJ with MMPL/SSD domain